MRRFASFDGVPIAYEVLGGPGARFPVVMHHGFASDSRLNWVRPQVARAVVSAGFEVVLIDARGHGQSGKPHDPAAYAGGAMVRDVRGVLDELGSPGVHFVGYSMGAFVGVRLALVEPRVASLVLGGAGAGLLGRFPRGPEALAEGLEADDPATITSRRARAVRNFADATKADRRALAALQRAFAAPLGLDDLARISVPTLVLNGAADTLAGPAAGLADHIPGAIARTVPGDHLSAVVQVEFAAAIVEFLAGIGR